MSQGKLSLLVLAALLGLPRLASQSVPLEQIAFVSVQGEPAAALAGPLKCDSDGNIYLRPLHPGSRFDEIVLRISSDGSNTKRFSLVPITGLQQAIIPDFAVDERGSVYLLAYTGSQSYLVVFDKDGQQVSKTKIEFPVIPRQIGVLQLGRAVLISGMFVPPAGQAAGNKPAPESFTALFDASGTLVKRISLTDGFTPREGQSSSQTSRSQQESYERSLALSTIEVGDNGKVYLMRHAPEGPIYVLSSSGSLLRKLALTPPENGTLLAIKVAGGRIAALFVRKRAPEKSEIEFVDVQILDGETGAKTAEYHSSPRIGAALACYTPDVFTFVRSGEDGRFQIVRVAAR